MLGSVQMKSRELIARQGNHGGLNVSQSNQVSSQTLTLPQRNTQSVRQLNRPNNQAHKSFITRVFQNAKSPQQSEQLNNLNRQSRPNTNTPNSSGILSRKQRDSLNRTQHTPFSSEAKSSYQNLTSTKDKITPFSTYISNGSQHNYSSNEVVQAKSKDPRIANFVNSQREGLTRRQSLIESQLQGVFEDTKNHRSQYAKQATSQEKQISIKDFSNKKSQFAANKIPTPQGSRQFEERPSVSNTMDRFSSTEFMLFAKKKSLLGVDSFLQYGTRSISMLNQLQQNDNSHLADTSNAGLSVSPQKRQSIAATALQLEQNSVQNQQQKQSTQAPLIHQLTLLSHNPKLLNNNSSSTQIYDSRKSYANTPTNEPQKDFKEQRTSEQIMKDFFPDIATKARVPDATVKRNEELIQQKKKRLEQYDQIFNELKNKRKTFSKFAFKSHEKQDNAQIRPVLEDLADGEPKGTMTVIDLWSDKNINKFLGNCKLIKDKLLISKIAAIKKRRGFFLDEKKPFLLSRKDELNLINKVYMSEQSKQFQEKYSKQLQKTMQNNSEINKQQLGTQQIKAKKLADKKCNKIGCTHKSCRQYLNQQKEQQKQQMGGLSKKLIEFNAEEEEDGDLDSSNSSSHSQLSIKEVNQKKMSVNYNRFLRQSNIIKAPTNASQMYNRESITSQSSKAAQNKDLDYLQEQNDKDYVKLVETINTLQDRIVQQKVNNFEAQSSGNEY